MKSANSMKLRKGYDKKVKNRVGLNYFSVNKILQPSSPCDRYEFTLILSSY
jgi:hypothetical protein